MLCRSFFPSALGEAGDPVHFPLFGMEVSGGSFDSAVPCETLQGLYVVRVLSEFGQGCVT